MHVSTSPAESIVIKLCTGLLIKLNCNNSMRKNHENEVGVPVPTATVILDIIPCVKIHVK